MPKRVLYLMGLFVLVMGLVLTACGPQATPEPVVEEPTAVVVEEEPTEAVVEEEPTEEVMEEPTEEVMEEPTEEVVEEAPEESMMDLSGTTVSFWHVYGEGDTRKDVIDEIVADFNATNEYGITVEALDQGQYNDVLDKVNAGLTSGDIPNIVQAYTSSFLNWDTIDAVTDLAPFVADADYGLTQEEIDAIYPGAFADGMTLDGRRLAWPMSQSANVVTYNYTWAQELGFDAPPANAAEFKEQVCAAANANASDDNADNDGTGGMVWFPSASNYLSFVYAFGGQELNEAGDAYDFTTQPWIDAALFINEMKAEGCTFETESYPNPEQANRLALVTLSSTAGLPFYAAAFEEANNEDAWGFLPFVGPDGQTAADAFTQSVGVLKSNEAEDLASWLFIRFMTTAENQAKWITASGYLPTLSTVEPLLGDYLAAEPLFQTSLDLASDATAEPQTFPAWSSVRRAIDTAAAQLYDPSLTEEDIVAILTQLNVEAADYVAEVE
jgi:multiple sugar transport system substrate-binding protein/sn-glycerol 3-phosphate transport system substrate-binding protein